MAFSSPHLLLSNSLRPLIKYGDPDKGSKVLIRCVLKLKKAQSELIVTMSPHAAAAAKSLQSCLTLSDPIDGSPPGSPVPGILQARTLEWVAISSFRESAQPRDQTHISYISCIGRMVFSLLGLPGKPQGM